MNWEVILLTAYVLVWPLIVVGALFVIVQGLHQGLARGEARGQGHHLAGFTD